MAAAGEIIVIDLASAGAVEQELSGYLDIIQGDAPPFEPVGWTNVAVAATASLAGQGRKRA